jgi:hypothetical protein
MPYSLTSLTQSGNALSLEMKTALDAALTASGKYTKVTNAYVSTTRTFDVWKNDGTTDGYEWYLIVMTDTAQTGKLWTGGCLEYDPGTQIAKKALRGGSTTGFVDANGYPLVSAGGAEMTFALGAFTYTSTNTIGSTSAAGVSQPTAAAAGNLLRVLVTGQVAWHWWGTASAGTYCQGVGTYQTLHGIAGQDAKPLAFIAHSAPGASSNGGTVWQHPSASHSYPRVTLGTALTSGTSSGPATSAWTPPIGKVGASGQDMNYGSNYVGSRWHLIRDATSGVNDGGGSSYSTQGFSLGLAPADFLIFGRQSACAIGDTITVNGKLYENVTTPSSSAGLFICKQPAV